MALESTFRVEVTGDNVFGRTFSDLTAVTFTAMKKLDPNVRVEEHHFGKLGYRADWYGAPVHFDVIDNLQGKLVRVTKTFLVDWKLKFIINYREEG